MAVQVARVDPCPGGGTDQRRGAIRPNGVAR